MDKQDIMYSLLAVGIVLIIAFVVKPALTGETLEIFPSSESDAGENVMHTPTVTPVITTMPTQLPLPKPPENKGDGISFVDPEKYNIKPNPTPLPVNRPYVLSLSKEVVNYENISSESGAGGATEIFHIPFPWWEIQYEVKPYNIENSEFSIRIIDASDPNRRFKNDEISIRTSEFVDPDSPPNPGIKTGSAKLFEGYTDYYLIIDTTSIEYYDIGISVPEKYVVDDFS